MANWIQLTDRASQRDVALPVSAITQVANTVQGTAIHLGSSQVLVQESYDDVLRLIGAHPSSTAGHQPVTGVGVAPGVARGRRREPAAATDEAYLET